MSATQAHVDRLAKVIEATEYAQVVKKKFTDTTLHVMCRVMKGSEKQWAVLIDRLLRLSDLHAAEPHSWQSHFCKNYFLKDMGDGKKALVYGWGLSFSSTDMAASVAIILPAIKGEPGPAPVRRVVREVEEMEMTGLTQDRNVPKNRGDRGAFMIGSKSKKNNFSPI